MESQSQNPEFRNNPSNVHPCIYSKFLKKENSKYDFSKYSLIQNKFRTQWIQRIGPIYDFF